MLKKVILDCDPGMDDSLAIMMACKSDKLDVRAITTVSGNCHVDVTSLNARKVLELIDKTNIPVARGMDKPIARVLPKDPFTHGKDGQAEAFLPEPAVPLSEKHAMDLLIDVVKENPGEIYIVALGPLTNVAMAMLKAPEIKTMIAGIYAISGAFGLNKYAYANATGATPQSEWNVYVDPEAAEIVYNSGVNMVALGLDVATHFDVNFTKENIKALEDSSRKEAGFLLHAIKFVNNRGFDSYCTIIDCMAVGYAIDSSIAEVMRGRVGIETRGDLTLGMTVLDSRHHHFWENLPQIEIACSVDYDRFLKMFLNIILS